MDKSYIMPFINSVRSVFATMVKLQVQVLTPSLKTSGASRYAVSGIVGMTGDVEGVVVLSFPTATAERIVSLLSGVHMDQNHADFPDAVGELVNMVSGAAKAQFPGKFVNITCPSVIIGADHGVYGSKDIICLMIPCTSDCGDFCLEFALRKDSLTDASKAPSATAA